MVVTEIGQAVEKHTTDEARLDGLAGDLEGTARCVMIPLLRMYIRIEQYEIEIVTIVCLWCRDPYDARPGKSPARISIDKSHDRGEGYKSDSTGGMLALYRYRCTGAGEIMCRVDSLTAASQAFMS